MRSNFRWTIKIKLSTIMLALTSSPIVCSSQGMAQDSDPIKILGFNEAVAGKEKVQSAVDTVDAILAVDGKYRIESSWSPAQDSRNARHIKVYTVKKDAATKDFDVMVPYDCDCIFIQPDVFEEKIVPLYKELPQMLSIDERDALAFMLLHEVGHISNGDFGYYASPEKARQYNYEENRDKTKELAADAFAANNISSSSSGQKPFRTFLASMALQLVVTNISYNLSVLRHLKYFGGTTLCSRFLFADDGFTHPNLEMRFLSANNIIAHTEISHELLQSFEKCRTTPPDPIVYIDRK